MPPKVKKMDSAPAFVRALLAHFDATRRDLPWRSTTDPYRIWISEVMLQQTRVETVIPYYDRWMQQFPSVATLADASEQVVLRAWEGLGYYSRARNLHAAAKVVRERHSGLVPDSVEGLRALPGIGAYTAGAVSSIAYGVAEPAIDGNARRVFSRILDMADPSLTQIHTAVRDIIPADRPGDFNQAVMELGATICTPRPCCSKCPVQWHCRAFALGTVHLRPGVSARKASPVFNIAVVVLIDADGRALLTQRPPRGLLAGFWTFPAAEPQAQQSSYAKAARRMAAALVSAPLSRARRLDPVSHAFSHRTEVYHPFVYHTRRAAASYDTAFRWVAIDSMHELPVPVAQRRIARAAGLVVHELHL
ncbi:MAG: A/G-specific adenine glycosylase [Longimicrobiales bacterium]